jgi:threonylcarbamoyladenosine tRNA methylthiotransferase MtaB
MKTVAFYTLGCKVNQYETQAMVESMVRAGYGVIDFSDRADVYVINSCTVTGTGDKKTRQMVRRAHRANPGALIVVAGCYTQRASEEIAVLPGVRVLLGIKHKGMLPELVERAFETGRQVTAVESVEHEHGYEQLVVTQKPAHTHAYVKIQDGCNRYCSYCIIPFARGPVRSRPVEDVLNEVRALAAGGCVEIVLTGIHVASYGADLDGDVDLPAVIEAIHTVEGIGRIRLSSLEPLALTDAWIKRMRALPKLCRHFHLSLQSGSDSVLARMRRRYGTAAFADRVGALKKAFPGCAITTDVMVGFPGETEEEFAQTLDFVREIGFARCHVFPYSMRPGTDAAHMPMQVPRSVKEERAARLIALAKELEEDFVLGQAGEVREVLFETCEDGMLEGYTSEYVRVCVPGRDKLVGRLSRVRIQGIDGDAAYGEIA